MKRVASLMVACLWAGWTLAAENLLPAGFVRALCERRNTGVTYLSAADGMPEGVRITTDRAHEPIYRIETSAAVPGAVKKGDLLVLTAAVRGVAAKGKVAVLAKFQDNTYTGALRENLTGGEGWTWCRVTGVAPKDYAAGSMRLHLYPWTGAQQVEIRDWKLENLGPVSAKDLPPLAAPPAWPAPKLSAPEPPPPEKPVELAPLTPEQRAKKRYCILKFDDVVNVRGRVNARFDRVAKFLAARQLHSGFGVIVKSIADEPNAEYIAWLKRNAIENGGLIEFWNHGWDHAMFFTCTEADDDCDRTAKFHGEFGTGLLHQRRHMEKSLATFKQHTGLTMRSFGSAGNALNAHTATVLKEHPEVKVWIFGKEQKGEDLLALGRWLNLEYSVGKVDYVDFVKHYQHQRQKDYIVLQGHAAMWNDAHFEAFTQVIDLLQKEGWIFVTPYEFYQLKKENP